MISKLMIVDDEPNNLELFRYIFEDDDIEILCCESGDKALEVFDNFVPDVVLLDIMMPGADGISVCRDIKNKDIGKNTKVILVTGMTGKDIEKKGWDAGCDQFLNKPVSLDVLRSEVFAD